MFRDGVARLLVFRVGDECFAIPLSDVDEVMDAQLIQRVPDAPVTVLGVTLVRGALVTVYDSRPLLSIHGSAEGALLLFDHGNRRAALAIDEVFDAVLVDERELRPVPGHAASDGVLTGVIRRGTDLIAVIDVDRLPGFADVSTGARI